MPQSRTLTPEQANELAELKEQASIQMAQRSLRRFCQRMSPHLGFQPFHQAIIDHIEAVSRGDIEQLMIFCPPRHGKSEILSNHFPAWHLGRNPSEKIILASYGLALAQRGTYNSRNRFEDPRWPFDAILASDSKASELWRTSVGGECLAAGVGSAITGFGADILIIDDPFQGRKQADSKTIREDTWNWYQDDAATRLMPGGRTILCQTRWHEDDLAGRLLNADQGLNEWTVLSLPAIAEANDPAGREIGTELDPVRFPLEMLQRIKRRRGPRAWNSLYMQRPGSIAGNMFKKNWWQYYNPETLRRQGLRAEIIAVDPAIGGGADNDYSAITVWGQLDGHIYLIDIWAEKVPYVELRPQLEAMYATHKAPLLIEDVGPGKILLQQIRQSSHAGRGMGAIPAIPWKLNSVNASLGETSGQMLKKRVRAEAITAAVEGGLVHLPIGHPQLDLFVDQMTDFPTGRHDDLVDTAVMGVHRLSEYLEEVLDCYFQDFALKVG
jgi:predicted phage terminase large subunit-like protein